MNWTLVLGIFIGGLGVVGLAVALQTPAGRERLASAALALAETLLAYAIRWLESLDVPGPVTMLDVETYDLARAKSAYSCLTDVMEER